MQFLRPCSNFLSIIGVAISLAACGGGGGGAAQPEPILFTSDRDGNLEVYVMNADGTGSPTNLTNNLARDDRSNQ